MITNKYKIQKVNFKKGSGLVEILVAIFVFTVILSSLIFVSSAYLSGSADSLKSAKGAYLAQEGIEVVKIMRDYSWTNISGLSTSTTYYIYWNTSSSTNNTWATTTTYTTTDSVFTRTLKFDSVSRDANGRIVASGGKLDVNSRKVTVSISWKAKTDMTTKTLSTYITNLL